VWKNQDVAQKAIVLLLSGIQLQEISALPEVEMLMKRGAMVELDPSPITGPLAQYYQVFSGRSAASFGFFDTLVPRDYSVVEESTGRGVSPKLLPDLLRTVGWTVQFQEKHLSEIGLCLSGWTQTTTTANTCFIIKSTVEAPLDGVALTQALEYARAWVGETGLLAILSDRHSAPVKRFVNINNFLAEMGILERNEQGGHINWSNSLAYYAGHGQLWVNLLGRDPQGAIHPLEYDEVRDSLRKALPTRLRDGETPVIERVYRKEELYSSEYLFCLPDLIVVFKPGYAPSPQSTRIDFDTTIFTTPADATSISAGIHPSNAQGFLLVSAPGVMQGEALQETVPLTAVVPTLLHALGVEYVDMETPAVSGLFSPSYLEQHPIRSSMSGQEVSEEDEERIINHLRDLGYV
jgi:hypothetical protein